MRAESHGVGTEPQSGEGGGVGGEGEGESNVTEAVFCGYLAMLTLANVNCGAEDVRAGGWCAVASFPACRPSRLRSDNTFPLKSKRRAKQSGDRQRACNIQKAGRREIWCAT